MRLLTRALCALLPVIPAAGALGGEIFIEEFTGGSNTGGWTFGSPNGFIDPVGGNPGEFYHDPFLDTFAPQPRTTEDSIFNGDYQAQGVTAIGIDLVLFDVDFSAGGRPLSIMLLSDNDTPANFNDDWAAYFIGPDNVPLPGEGWKSYDFDVPSDSDVLPPGWQTVEFGPDANPNWSDVIVDVDQLVFFYGDPTFFYIFQAWDLGMDNPRISYVPEPSTALLLIAGAMLRRRR